MTPSQHPLPSIKTKRGWKALGEGDLPQIGESESLRIRGLEPRRVCYLGGRPRLVDESGEIHFKLLRDEDFRGHIGHLRIEQEGVVDAEIKVFPDKMSERRYRELRRELEALWLGITLDPESAAALALTKNYAPLPPVRELWEKIDSEVSSIALRPRQILQMNTRLGRLEQVRHSREVTTRLIFNGQVGLPGPMNTLSPNTSLPENAMVGEVMRKLLQLSKRDPDSDDLAHRLQSLLELKPFSQRLSPGFQPTHGVLRDRRYLQLFSMYQYLNRRESIIVEGPGEIRQGVRALQDLWEYWVFLQVVKLCNAKFGEPPNHQLKSLARPISGGRIRLELPPQATVEYPNGLLVSYEPLILKDSDQSWRHLCLADKSYEAPHWKRTPDVVLFIPGDDPRAVVLDAKYVGMKMIDADSITIHKRYGRLTYRGKSVRSEVFAVHPHEHLRAHYAGHGHFAMWPGHSINGDEIFDFLFPGGSKEEVDASSRMN